MALENKVLSQDITLNLICSTGKLELLLYQWLSLALLQDKIRPGHLRVYVCAHAHVRKIKLKKKSSLGGALIKKSIFKEVFQTWPIDM